MNKNTLLLYTVILIASMLFKLRAAPIVKLETSFGDVLVEMDSVNSPITVSNFLTYVNDSFYDSTIFHRVIDNFCVQGGQHKLSDGKQKKTYNGNIANESDNMVKNLRGTISMARRSDPHSAASQFFFNLKDNPHLDYRKEPSVKWGYAVFGKVISGMEVIDSISKVKVDKNNYFKPKVDVALYRATVVNSETKIKETFSTPVNKYSINIKKDLLIFTSDRKTDFEVLDIRGRVQLKYKNLNIGTHCISTSNLSKGCYVVRLKGANGDLNISSIMVN